MKMFADMKTCIIKELVLKLEGENLMNDHLNEFFSNEIKGNKLVKLTVNKTEKKTKKNGYTKKTEKKEKRAPTEHQSRVSECMAYLKEKFPDVKHTIRMGTANYMATYLKDNDCLIVNTQKPIFEKAFLFATQKMNDKEKKQIFILPSSSSVIVNDNEEEKEVQEEEEQKEEEEEEESDEEEEEEESNEEEDMTDLAEESDDE